MISKTISGDVRAKSVEVVQTIATNTSQPPYQIWQRVYGRLADQYGLNLSAHPRKGGESLLSVAERCGYIEQVYHVVLLEWLFTYTDSGSFNSIQ